VVVGDENVTQRVQAHLGASQLRGDAHPAIKNVSRVVDENHL
jgi:hypothetical protein